MPFLAQNPLTAGAGTSATSGAFVSPAANNPISLNPLFGRPVTYVDVTRSPVAGPQPRLARGSGDTGNGVYLPGNDAMLPGYLTDNEYFPTTDEYQPAYNPSFTRFIPKFIGVGENGRDVVGTYQPHPFNPGQRFFNQNRSAANWQVMSYPPDNRNLLAVQMVRKYQLQNRTLLARPLSQNDYFLGYQINNDVQASIGQTPLGVLGGV